MRKVITDIVGDSTEFEVVGTARHGLDALKQIHALDPEIVTLDVEMPELDGLQTLGYIMSETPRPVVMLSAATGRGGDDPTLRALEAAGIPITAHDTGGDFGRSVFFDVADGRVTVRSLKRGELVL